MAEGLSLSKEIELHRELSDLALECRDLGLAVVDQRCFDVLACELTAIELRQPRLNQIGRQAVLCLRVVSTDRAASNVPTELQPELRSAPPIGAS